MSEEEILNLWHQGITRLNLAKIYQRRYNQQIKIIRLDIRNRHVKFITYNEALSIVEKILLKNIGGTNAKIKKRDHRK